MFRPITALALIVALAAPAAAQATSVPGAPAPRQNTAQNGTISGQTDTFSAIRAYCRHARIAFQVIPGTPNPPFTADVRHLTNKEALQTILDGAGLASQWQGHVLWIGTPQAVVSKFGVADRTHRTYTIVGLTPSSVAQSLSTFLPVGTVLVPNDAQHTLFMSGTPQSIETAGTFIAGIGATGALVTQAIPLASGVSANTMAQELQVLDPPQPPNAVVFDPGQNAFIVRGTDTYVAQVKSDLAAIDHEPEQVFYSFSVIEVDPGTFESNRGLLFGGTNQSQTSNGFGGVNISQTQTVGSWVLGFPVKTTPLAVKLNALEQNGKARILQRPSVLASNGQATLTEYTTNLPVQVSDQFTGISTIVTVPIGITMNLTPHIGQGAVSTDVDISYKDETGLGQGGYPIVSDRHAKTSVVTAPDDSIVISGLYGESDTDTRTGLPPFNHLFVLGKLFQNHQISNDHTEVIIVMTPHLVKPGDRTLPVSFPNIDPALIQHGIAPATPQPGMPH